MFAFRTLYMKKILLFALVAVFAMAGCKEDFDVAAPYKQVTVVYGILDQLDTAHYIRIQKAFLDQNKSAIDMSKESDSSYYTDIDVKMLEFNPGNGNLISQIKLDKVNMALEGYPKNAPANEQGFFTNPSYAYKFKKDLSPYNAYRLLITHASGRVDSSDVLRVVNSDSSKTAAYSFFVNDFAKTTYTLDFAKTTLAANEILISGKTPMNGYKLEGKIRFNYLEKNVVDNTQKRKYVDMYISSKSPTYDQGATFQLSVPNKNIYSFLHDAIGTAPANTERYIDNCDVWVYAGSRELYTYQQVNLAQTGGLTGDQIKPNYTNMLGENSLGLLASRTYRFYTGAYINNTTLDSLKINPLTQPLNIKGRP